MAKASIPQSMHDAMAITIGLLTLPGAVLLLIGAAFKAVNKNTFHFCNPELGNRFHMKPTFALVTYLYPAFNVN